MRTGIRGPHRSSLGVSPSEARVSLLRADGCEPLAGAGRWQVMAEAGPATTFCGAEAAANNTTSGPRPHACE
jgi:hypothetical protein